MVTKTVNVDGKEVAFRSSAAIPRMYRIRFKRDIFKDLQKLQSSFDAASGGTEFTIDDLELFENVAYIMARHADSNVPDSIEDWLDQFEMFSIYQILPEILDMWGVEMHTESESKKNRVRAATGR